MEQTMNNELSHLQKSKQHNSISECSIEPKFRLNIKQNTKLEKYWDITCRGDSIEELAVDIEKLKKVAMIQCNQIVVDAEPHDTKDYKGD